jgi:hypothetical protein
MPSFPPDTCISPGTGDGADTGMVLDHGKMGKKDTGRFDGQVFFHPCALPTS